MGQSLLRDLRDFVDNSALSPIDSEGFRRQKARYAPCCYQRRRTKCPRRGRWRFQHTMELNKLVFGGLALGCLTAAAGGGFLAARQNAAPVAEFAAAPTPGAATPVAESEGVIVPEAATPAPSPATVAVETPVRQSRTEPAARRRVEPPAARREATPARTTRNDPPARTATSSAPAGSPTASSGGSMWEVRPAVEPERRAGECRARNAAGAGRAGNSGTRRSR